MNGLDLVGPWGMLCFPLLGSRGSDSGIFFREGGGGGLRRAILV